MSTSQLRSFPLFPEFPAEIRECIYKQAFEDSERRAIHIALACHEAIFCRNHPTQFSLFVRQFYDKNNTKTRSFYTNHVQSIYIDELGIQNFSLDFLPLCRNLASLALNLPPLNELDVSILGQVLTRTNFPRLRKLLLGCEPLPQSLQTFSNPIYRHLTHLDIDAHSHIPWNGLQMLTSLTHIVYGEFLVISNDIREAAHQLKDLVGQAAPYFPPKLKCFIINLPIDIIYGAACMRDQSEERHIFDDIVAGRADRRVVMALRGGFQDPERSDVGRELVHIYPNPREEFLRFISPLPMFDYSIWVYLPLPVGIMDFWDEAEYRIRLRGNKNAPQ